MEVTKIIRILCGQVTFDLGFERHLFFQDSLYPEENEPNNKKKLDIDRHNSNEESISGENNLFLFHENRGRNIQVSFPQNLLNENTKPRFWNFGSKVVLNLLVLTFYVSGQYLKIFGTFRHGS